MKLYDYFRSTACYRVRIALNIKGIAYEKASIHLVNNNGEQHSPEYRSINSQELVPSLETDGHIMAQSLAIIEYLEEQYPHPSLLPENPFERATARSLAQMICCDVHPLNNLRVLSYLRAKLALNNSQINAWYHHWLKAGFDAFESKLQTIKRHHGFCIGNTVSVADLCLIPQVYNANRFCFPLETYPLIGEINEHCLNLKAFQDAIPKE